MQTTLLGLAIAFIVALVAALIGPYFVDWNQFRPQFEAEATRIIGAPVRVGGELDARLLPTPTLRLRSVTVGGPNDLGKIHADKLDVEFSLGELMRGDWRADELTIDGLAVDLGLDPQGRVDLPETSGAFDLGSLSIARLNLNGRVALHDAASRSTLELSDITFSGDVRSLAGSLRGGGDFSVRGTRYPFRVSSGQGPDGNGTRIHLSIDPGDRPVSADLDGVLDFVSRAPRFQGALTLAAAAQPKANAEKDAATPWRISTRVKADDAKAQLDHIEASYGNGDQALKFAGSGDVRFGASPRLHAVLAARRLDADRLIAPGNGKDKTAAQPSQWLPVLRKALAALPHPPIATQIEASAEQIMLGGRPLQNLFAAIHGDATSWSIDRLDLRMPGSTQVSLTAAEAPAAAPGSLSGTLDVDSSDPGALAAWLQGRSDTAIHHQRPLRLHGKVGVSPDRVSAEAMRAEIGGSTIEGSLAFADPSAGPSRIDATLKADHLDLDATTALLRSLAGPQAKWPQQAAISLDVDRAVSAGQDLQPFAVKVSYDPKVVTLERLKLGEANGLALDGSGHFDRKAATGTVSLNASAPSLGEIGALVAPLAPALASRVDAMGAAPGPAHLGLTLALGDSPEKSGRARARATLNLDSPELKGAATLTAQPELAALRGFDLQKLRQSKIDVESRLSAGQGNSLLALLGLDRAVAAAEGTMQFDGSASGVWGSPLRLKAKLTGGGIDADANGTADPWAKSPDASVELRARSVNLAPLFGLKPSDPMMANTRLFARLSLADNKLTVDDLDGLSGGSRLRGHLSVTLDDAREVEGEVGLDALDLAPVFAVAIGAAGRSTSDPLGGGLLKGWHGHIAFQALRADLPGGVELRPLSGTVKGDGQALSFDGLKGGVGGGEVTASIDERPGGDGIALNARLNLAGVQGAALRYRGLRMPAGHASGQITLATQGRSVAALLGALSGSGTLTLAPAKIQGLDPQAFDVAIRASDRGQAMDDAKLRQIVEPVLSAGTLPVASAQIPFTIRDGRLRVDATTLASANAQAIVSGGYDIPADQADIRVSLTSTDVGSVDSRPEIRLFAAGAPDALHASLDLSGFSSWLAVRAIDRETRRLDSIERGEPVAQRPSAASPATAALPPASPDTDPLEQPRADIAVPGRGPRRAPRPRPAASALQPMASQQLAPLPPPIVVRPAPHPVRPKPRLPLMLTPAGPNQ